MTEALKQLRVSLTAMLTVSLVWLVTTRTVEDALVRRQHAKELLAWLSVRDSLMPGAAELAEEKRDDVTHFVRLVPTQSGSDVEEPRRIEVNIPLLDHAAGTLTLRPLPGIPGVYRVSSTVASVNLSSYFAASIHGRIWVIPSELELKTLRDFHNASLRDNLATPRRWPRMKAELLSLGWGGSEPTDLKINDPTLSKFLVQALSATFSVASIPVSAPMYPAAIALFLTLIGFIMVGPILKIRAGSAIPENEPWVLVADAPGVLGKGLACAKAFVALLYVALPIVVCTTQAALWHLLEPPERAVWLPACIVMLAVPIPVLYAASALWRLRDIHALPTSQAQQGAAPNSRPPSQLPAIPEAQPPDSQRTSSSGGCG